MLCIHRRHTYSCTQMHRLLVLHANDELFNCQAVAKSHAPQTARKRETERVCARTTTITVMFFETWPYVWLASKWEVHRCPYPTHHNNISCFKFRSICCRLRLTCIARQRTVLRCGGGGSSSSTDCVELLADYVPFPCIGSLVSASGECRTYLTIAIVCVCVRACVCEGVCVCLRCREKYQHCIHCCCFLRFSWDWTAVLFRHEAFTIYFSIFVWRKKKHICFGSISMSNERELFYNSNAKINRIRCIIFSLFWFPVEKKIQTIKTFEFPKWVLWMELWQVRLLMLQ